MTTCHVVTSSSDKKGYRKGGMSSIFFMKMFYIYGFYFSKKVKSYGLQLRSPNVKTFLVILKNATVTLVQKELVQNSPKIILENIIAFHDKQAFGW